MLRNRKGGRRRLYRSTYAQGLFEHYRVPLPINSGTEFNLGYPLAGPIRWVELSEPASQSGYAASLRAYEPPSPTPPAASDRHLPPLLNELDEYWPQSTPMPWPIPHGKPPKKGRR